MSDEPVEPAGMEGYRALAVLLSEVERREGVAPEAVEEKAALEARLAAQAVILDGVPVSWTVSETRWDKGKMETPGIQQWKFEYTLKLDVDPARVEDVVTQVRAYWLKRGLRIRNWEPDYGVSASPDRGLWLLSVGALDEASMYARVVSGPVTTSSNPLRSEKAS